MSNKLSEPMGFWDLKDEDKDLTMFIITNLTLTKEDNKNMVFVAINLKRKVVTELLTTKYYQSICWGVTLGCWDLSEGGAG